MKTYLVGGAVRDRLLGLPVRERDYLVVGATPRMLRERGFRQVGRDFPIFLHPESQAEYALARTQRRASDGAGEPRPQAHPGVTLEEDLGRRDLTINAMAETEEGVLIDPYGGQRDLQGRWLRHVSPAFADDPLRVLRVARFMARFAALGFRVAPETLELMRRMTREGALDGLVAERVWKELMGALGCDDPRPFFTSLRACGALARVLPELDRLWGVPQPPRWHPEIDCGEHSLLALKAACERSPATRVRFAALTHDLGKGTTRRESLPSHPGHEGRGARLVANLCQRLRAPRDHRELAQACARYHTHCHRLDELRPSTVLKLLEGLDAFRRPQRLDDFLLVCEADFYGRKGFAGRPYPQAERLRRLYQAARRVEVGELVQRLQGRALGEALHRLRLSAIGQGR